MNKFIASLCAIAAIAGLAVSPAIAQPAPKIAVVDMAKLLDGHPKTEEQNTKLKADEAKANEELEKINKEGQVMVEQLKELEEQGKNPGLNDEAKAKLQGDMRLKIEEIQKKQNEVQSFRSNTQRSLQQRIQNFRKLMFEEITVAVNDVAQKKGANLVFDKSGPSLLGIPSLVYADPAFDITEDVLKEIAKGGAAKPAEAGSVTFPAAK